MNIIFFLNFLLVAHVVCIRYNILIMQFCLVRRNLIAIIFTYVLLLQIVAKTNITVAVTCRQALVWYLHNKRAQSR